MLSFVNRLRGVHKITLSERLSQAKTLMKFKGTLPLLACGQQANICPCLLINERNRVRPSIGRRVARGPLPSLKQHARCALNADKHARSECLNTKEALKREEKWLKRALRCLQVEYEGLTKSGHYFDWQ